MGLGSAEARKRLLKRTFVLPDSDNCITFALAMKNTDTLFDDSLSLLRAMIKTPSFSREEDGTAALIEAFMRDAGIAPQRAGNNVFAFAEEYDPARPTVLLNSHHDTVSPNAGYTRDPFSPDMEDGLLYGLGSNDAGASVVSLLAAFRRLCRRPLRFNLCIALTAEEEVSGAGGIESLLPSLGDIELAVVGEPTGMNPAIAERGLMVVDCTCRGAGGHAARREGDNAIYKAIEGIDRIRRHRFDRTSPYLGDTMMTVTVINAGTQHNVVPAECRYTVDVRMTERYTHEELLETIGGLCGGEAVARSMRLRPSHIAESHPFVSYAVSRGLTPFGSPTLSDQALIAAPSVKIGPGDSARSHTADEYVKLDEIRHAIDTYTDIIGHYILK